MTLERFVTIATYVFPWEAQLAKARLESEGIDAVVADENAAGIYGANAIGGIKLRAREEDAGRAADLLRTLRPLPEIYLVTEEDSRRARCPVCRSEDLADEGWFRRRWSCRACGAAWKDSAETAADPDNPGQEPESELAERPHAGLVTVARFDTPWQAHLARTLLESQGIDACVLEERLPPLSLLTGEPLALNRVEVHTADAGRAFELLAEVDAGGAAESMPAE
jgi:hypothetical protein